MIYTKEPLDRETTSFFWLTVYAQDLGSVPLSSMTEIYVEIDDINDNIPLTANPVYYPTIPEHSPEGTSVLQLQAFDLDDEASPDLTYEITGGNPQGFFAIDRQTGRLHIWKKIGLLSTLVISNNYTTTYFSNLLDVEESFQLFVVLHIISSDYLFLIFCVRTVGFFLS